MFQQPARRRSSNDIMRRIGSWEFDFHFKHGVIELRPAPLSTLEVLDGWITFHEMTYSKTSANLLDREGWLAYIIGEGARNGSKVTAYSSASECMDREGWLVSYDREVFLDGYRCCRDLGGVVIDRIMNG